MIIEIILILVLFIINILAFLKNKWLGILFLIINFLVLLIHIEHNYKIIDFIKNIPTEIKTNYKFYLPTLGLPLAFVLGIYYFILDNSTAGGEKWYYISIH